jgi:hypothetical protein
VEAAGYLQRLAHGYFRASEQLKFTAYRLVSKSIAVCILFLSRADLPSNVAPALEAVQISNDNRATSSCFIDIGPLI